MSEGLFGKRDIDKYVFAVPFPTHDPDNDLHNKLVAGGARAETVAAAVDLSKVTTFQASRKAIREALIEDGVEAAIEELVNELLTPVEIAV